MRSGSRAGVSSFGGTGIPSITGSGFGTEGISRAVYVNETGAPFSGITIPAGTARSAGPAAGMRGADDASVVSDVSAGTGETTGSTAEMFGGPNTGRNSGARTVRVT